MGRVPSVANLDPGRLSIGEERQITATQFLLGAGDPEQALGDEMHRIFADRIETNRSMLRHMRAGTDPGALPSLDADESVIVPEAAPGTPVGSTPKADGVTKPELIVFRIESTPPGAEVSIDGEVRGTTPLDRRRHVGGDRTPQG